MVLVVLWSHTFWIRFELTMIFDSLAIASPQIGPSAVRTSLPRMRVPLGPRLAFSTPWVAYDLPWELLPRQRAAQVADAIDSLGIAVAGLRCDISQDEEGNASLPLSICPYRGDRYGLELADLRAAKIVDIRLAHRSDQTGLPVYSPAQMERWDLRATKSQRSDAAMFGPMHAVSWPPDVASLDALKEKVDQLKILAPQAIVGISIGVQQIKLDLPAVIATGAELVAIRAENWPAQHAAQLAACVAWVRDQLDVAPHGAPYLLVVPPDEATGTDYVKLLALGADLIAVDLFCAELMQPPAVTRTAADWAAVNLGVTTMASDKREPELDLASLEESLVSLRGIVEQSGVGSVTDLNRSHLVSFGYEIPGVRKVL